ncbi:MAG: polysaccharide deacetylase family protein [Eubacteriales bacterium]|nr:polysaccharide deacetylase family protein [Eubacteriales bacterium]
MKGVKKLSVWIGVLTLLLIGCMMPVQAAKKITNAKTCNLKDVTKAQKKEGKWVKISGKVRFLEKNGTYVRNRWINAGGKIYYLDSKGNRIKGWIKYRKQLYYMDSAGKLYTGWLKLKKYQYYLKKNGTMAIGITAVDGGKYYFDKNGVKKTGWRTVGKNTYYFNKTTGKMQTDVWVRTSNGKYRYLKKNGKMAKSQWLNLNGKKYYVDSKGYRVTGTQYIGDKGYYFKKNGVYDPSVKVKMEVNPNKKMVALTFDDGPGQYTNRLLNALQKSGAKATFFMVGQNVPYYKNTVKRMANMGCELGNHSYSHPAFTSLSVSQMRSQVISTNNAIQNACGRKPTVFRLPYGDGASNSTVLSALGLPSIYWSIDTRDWANTGNSWHTVNAVLNNVRNGDIILMHDIHYATVSAAETIIPALKKRGYQMVTVSQLAKYKGKKTLRSGKTYYSFR